MEAVYYSCARHEKNVHAACGGKYCVLVLRVACKAAPEERYKNTSAAAKTPPVHAVLVWYYVLPTGVKSAGCEQRSPQEDPR